MPYASGAKCAHAEPGEARCEACKAERRQQEQLRRETRKAKRQCWVCGQRCVRGLTSCEAHRGVAWRSAS